MIRNSTKEALFAVKPKWTKDDNDDDDIPACRHNESDTDLSSPVDLLVGLPCTLW
jgi:hypothetical protein